MGKAQLCGMHERKPRLAHPVMNNEVR